MECEVDCDFFGKKEFSCSLNKNLILSDTIKETLINDISEFRTFNESEDCPYPVLWDTFKAYLRGRLIAIGTYRKKEREKHRKEILTKNSELENIHKVMGSNKIYQKLMAKRKSFKNLDIT